jgi:AcrR family transcriptional regulator
VVTPSTSAELILAATRRAIVAKGPGKLTLSAVAAAAGVSRPTLYRWFPTRADLFAALTEYERGKFDEGLQAEIGAHRAPARQLDAALRFLVTYLDGSLGTDPISVDPAFALQSLSDFLPAQVETLVRLLGPSLDQVPVVRSGALTRAQLADLFLRVAYSHYLVPHPYPEELLATMRTLAGLPWRSMTRAAG